MLGAAVDRPSPAPASDKHAFLLLQFAALAPAPTVSTPATYVRLWEEVMSFLQQQQPVASGGNSSRTDEQMQLAGVLAAFDAATVSLAASDPAFRGCIRLMVELVLLEGTKPLHRLLLAPLKKLAGGKEGQDVVGSVLCEYVLMESARLAATPPESGTAAVIKVPLAPGLISLMWLPSACSWLSHLASSRGPEGQRAIICTARAMMCCLQGVTLVREALSSAVAVLWMAALLPHASPAHCGMEFACGLFQQQQQQQHGVSGEGARLRLRLRLGTACSSVSERSGAAPGLYQAWLQQHSGSCLTDQLWALSEVAKLAVLKGLVTVLPMAALCAPLWCQAPTGHPTATPATITTSTAAQHAALDAAGAEGSSEGAAVPEPGEWVSWNWLRDGALASGCRAMTAAPDSHVKFFAASVLMACMARALAAWQEAENGQQQQQQDQPRKQTAQQQRQQKGRAQDTDEIAGDGVESIDTAPPSWSPPVMRQSDVDTVMSLVLSHLDEPLAQTVKKVQELFEALVQLLEAQQRLMQADWWKSAATAASDSAQLPTLLTPFLEALAVQLLTQDNFGKGRFGLLVSLVPRVGAVRLLALQPSLIPSALELLANDMLSGAVGGFLEALLSKLYDECRGGAQGGGVGSAEEVGEEAWTECWLPHVLDAMLHRRERQRTCVCVYVVPLLLKIQPTSGVCLLREIVASGTIRFGAVSMDGGVQLSSPQLASVVCVLKACRQAALMEGLDSLQGALGLEGLDVRKMLLSAVTHSSTILRCDVLQLAALNPRLSELPGKLELEVTASPPGGQRNRAVTAIGRLVERIRLGVRVLMATKEGAATAGQAQSGRVVKAQGRQQVLLKGPGGGGVASRDEVLARQQSFMQAGSASSDQETLLPSNSDGAAVPFSSDPLCVVRHALSHAPPMCVLAQTHAPPACLLSPAPPPFSTKWLTRHLVLGLYPGGPFARKALALDLMGEVMTLWAGWEQPPAPPPVPGGETRTPATATPSFQPFWPGLHSAPTTALLLGGVVDSWDRVRAGSWSLLLALPCPLPGLGTPELLQQLLGWALGLVGSPRQRESDAGARLFRLVCSTYVARLHWVITLHNVPGKAALQFRVAPPAAPSSQAAAAGGSTQASQEPQEALFVATLSLLQSLLQLLDHRLELARRDLVGACRKGLAHGPLLLLRYVVEDMEWGRWAGGPAYQAAAMRGWLQGLMEGLDQVSDIALPYLTKPEDHGTDAGDVQGEGGGGGSDDGGADAGPDTESDAVQLQGGGGESGGGAGADAGQGVFPCHRRQLAQLRGCEVQVVSSGCWTSMKEVGLMVGSLAQKLPMPEWVPGSQASGVAAPLRLVDEQQLASLGGTLLSAMLAMKHNGTVEKAAIGMGMLASVLMHTASPALNALPGLWMDRCLARVVEAGQCRDDVTRRSSGLPFALVSLLLCEPANSPKAILHRAVAFLLKVATAPVREAGTQQAGQSDTAPLYDGKAQMLVPGASGDKERQGAADSGGFVVTERWHAVHAFNVLRHIFTERSLSVDVSGFLSAGVEASLLALRSPHWEIRNSGSLAFTALTMRLMGHRNSLAASAVSTRGGTALELWARYPGLHGLLLSQLREAAEELEWGGHRPDAQHDALEMSHSCKDTCKVHPSLFPVLIILSLMRPSTGEADSPNAPPPNPTSSMADSPRLPPHHHHHHHPPTTSAPPSSQSCSAAQPPPLTRLTATLSALCHTLPGSVASPTDSDTQQQQRQQQRLGCNAIHGILLQVTVLLRVNATALPDPGSRQAAGELAATALLATLPHMLSSTDASMSAPYGSAVAAACIDAAEAALELLSEGGAGTAAALLAALQVCCAAAVLGTCNNGSSGDSSSGDSSEAQQQQRAGVVAVLGTDFPDPMRCVLMKAVARLWLGPALARQAVAMRSAASQASRDVATWLAAEMADRLKTCLASTSYDVRAASLKAVVPFFTALHQQLTSEATSPSTTQESAHDTTAVNSSNSNSTKQASRGRSSHLCSAAAAILLAHQPALGQLSTLLTALLARVVRGDAVAKVVRRALQVQALLGGIGSAAAAAEAETSRLPSFSSPSDAPPCFLMLVNSLSLQGVSEYGGSAAAAARSPVNTTHAADSTTASAANVAFPVHATDADSMQLAAQEPPPDVLDTVATLQRLFERATDFRTQAQALRCLGHSIRGLITATHQDTSAAHLPHFQSTLHTFMQSVIGCSAATQPEELRAAAVETLHACGLLLLPSTTQAQPGSDTQHRGPHSEVGALLLPLQWRALQQLVLMMEDEDKGVRERAAVLAAAAVPDSRSGGGGWARWDGGLPVCIEGVSRQLVARLVGRFGCVEGVSWGGGASEFVLDGGSRATLRLLVARAEGVSVPNPTSPPPSQVSPSQPPAPSPATPLPRKQQQPSQRIFLKELDNQYEEPLWVAQVAADLLHTHTLQQYASLAQHHAGPATPAAAPAPTTQQPHRVKAQLRSLDKLLQGSWQEAARGGRCCSHPDDVITTRQPGNPWDGGQQGSFFPSLQRALLLLWAVPPPSPHLLQLLQEDAAQRGTGSSADTSAPQVLAAHHTRTSASSGAQQACGIRSVHACVVGAIGKLSALVPVHHLLHDTLMEVGREWGVAADSTACGQGESPTASATASKGGSVDRDGVRSMLYLTF
ncbi:MAG: hypothetical protein WDW38_002483 [Sanguina aurantia]